MTETSKTFHIGEILSVTTGKLVCRSHVGGLYQILDHMTGESLMTHQLPRASDECAPSLREQFPDLAAVVAPDFGPSEGAEQRVFAWLDEQVATFGETRDVEPLAEGDHTHIDPLTELAMKFPGKLVVAVALKETDQ